MSELDALIAEKVMGGAGMCSFRCPQCGSDHFGSSRDSDGSWTRYCHGWCTWSGAPEDAVAPYSTDIAAAWEVVEKFEYCYLWLDTQDLLGTGRRAWECKLEAEDARTKYAVAPTAPLAICRAALKAVGHE